MTDLSILLNKPVYIYTGQFPFPYDSGAKIRIYTTARAYLDLGFTVEIVHLVNPNDKFNLNNQKIDLPVKISNIQLKKRHSPFINRLSFNLGFLNKQALNYIYPERIKIQDEINRKEAKTPDAIHHFEYLSTANSIIGLHGNFIWSCHDIQSIRYPKILAFRELIGIKHNKRKIRLKQRYLKYIEDKLVKKCKLVLTISNEDTKELQKRSGSQNIYLLPLSWPDETLIKSKTNWGKGEKLRLFHLGCIDAFIGFHSLKFILGEVFPILPNEILHRIEFKIAGEIKNSRYSGIIKEMAKNYDQVEFLGYVNDLKPYYQNSDVHLVGSNDATGLRTRIIESFAYGLPVLSTEESAKGIIGIVTGENILLANDAKQFAKEIIQIIDNPKILGYLAKNGRILYEKYYSRDVEAKQLGEYLNSSL